MSSSSAAREAGLKHPLHLAASVNDVRAICKLIAEGIWVHSVDYDERTALHVACLFRSFGAVRALLDNGARANVIDIFGETPLLLAVRDVRDDENSAAQVQIVRALLELNCRLNDCNSLKQTALSRACSSKMTEIVRLLIDAGASVVSTPERSPLHEALRVIDADMVEMILNAGANPSASFPGSRFAKPPIFSALVDTRLLRTLVSAGADVSACGSDGRTPLHIVNPSDSTEKCRILLDAGANTSTQDRSGNTPLHEYVESGHSTGLIRLLLHRGAAINATNNEGKTALMNATCMDRIHSMLVLLRAGADINTVSSADMTAAHYAAEQGGIHVAIISAFGGAVDGLPGTDPPLIFAAQGYGHESDPLLLRAGPFVALLLCGANPSIPYRFGDTSVLNSVYLDRNAEAVGALLAFWLDFEPCFPDRETCVFGRACALEVLRYRSEGLGPEAEKTFSDAVTARFVKSLKADSLQAAFEDTPFAPLKLAKEMAKADFEAAHEQPEDALFETCAPYRSLVRRLVYARLTRLCADACHAAAMERTVTALEKNAPFHAQSRAFTNVQLSERRKRTFGAVMCISKVSEFSELSQALCLVISKTEAERKEKLEIIARSMRELSSLSS